MDPPTVYLREVNMMIDDRYILYSMALLSNTNSPKNDTLCRSNRFALIMRLGLTMMNVIRIFLKIFKIKLVRTLSQ